MTKEEREAIRAQYNDYIAYECAIHGGTGVSGTGHEKGHHDFLEWLADGGFPYLLDALEVAEENREFWEENSAKLENCYQDMRAQRDRIDADRDRWKKHADNFNNLAYRWMEQTNKWEARAEALERAIRATADKCYSCKNQDCGHYLATGIWDCKRFEFDEARFGREG